MFRSLAASTSKFRRPLTLMLLCIALGLAVGAGAMFVVNRTLSAPDASAESQAADESGEHAGHGEHGGHDGHTDHEGHEGRGGEAGGGVHVTLPKRKWKSADLRVEEVESSPFQQVVWVTGKLTVNEDRTAHLYPLVDGRVHKVDARFGQKVEQGELLAVIDSREVGDAKLALHRDRLDEDIAEVNADWAETVNENTQQLIDAIEAGASLQELEQQFDDRPMGDYRDQLLSAYANLHKSKADFERLQELSDRGIAAGKELITARAAHEADQARLSSLLEQIKFSARRNALREQQQLEKARSAVATSEAQLLILGYGTKQLVNLDPRAEGEAISHYEIRAPFAGTILSKDVVFGERVGPDTKLFELADLDSLWVQADIYQKHLPLLETLEQDTLRFRHGERQDMHTAEIFYHGDVVDPETRTARLMAEVENPDRHLKPGMFVEVGLPGATASEVVEVPRAAVVQEEGESFVFVQPKAGSEAFRRQDVKLGASGDGTVQILEGLSPGDRVVVSGLFALKTAAEGDVESTHSH